MTRVHAHSGMDPDQMIEKYVKLRDKVKLIKEQQAAQLAPYNEIMERLEGWLLETLNQAGLSSMRSPSGTAYKSLRTTTKVVDREAWLNFVRENEAWDLIESRASKNAAEAIIEETQRPIPGVETSSEVVCNVRRASAGAVGK
jgi:hypothetical protein